MLALIISLTVLVSITSAAYVVHLHKRHSILHKKFQELQYQRDSYVENIIERICINESSLVEQRSMLDVSLAELETLAANSGSSWEQIIEHQPSNILSFENGFESGRPIDTNNGLIEITQRIRNRFWSYIPDDKSHLGGTIQTIDDFIEFLKLSINKFKAKKGIDIQFRLNADKIDTNKYLFHDQDFFVRWFIFISMFVRDERLNGTPPRLEINFDAGATPNSYHIKYAFILYELDILPEDFNIQYKLYFHTGLVPDEWENLNPSLLEALKMSSVFSIIVRAEVDKKFGNTMIYFERDALAVDDRSVFDQVLQLRRKYVASKLNYVSSNVNDYEDAHLKELVDEVGMSIQSIPQAEFHPSLLSRTLVVFIASDIDEVEQKKICKSILSCPFSKVRVCIISRGNEAHKRIHSERVQYVEIPLTLDKLNIVL